MTHNAKAELGGRIREARASKGWKQRELASEVEVEPITVSRWERGATTPDLDVLRSGRGRDREAAQLLRRRRDGPGAAPSADATIRKLEEAAERLNAQADRIAGLLDDVRAELARLR